MMEVSLDDEGLAGWRRFRWVMGRFGWVMEVWLGDGGLAG